MAESGYEDGGDESSYPRTLKDLMGHSTDVDSQYHYLGLLSINAFVWNLDINVCLIHSCNFQVSTNCTNFIQILIKFLTLISFYLFLFYFHNSKCVFLASVVQCLLVSHQNIWDFYLLIFRVFYFILLFKENMLKLQGLCAHDVEDEGQTRSVHVVDDCSMLRHQILTNCYYIAHRLNKPIEDPEECVIFSEYPPPPDSRRHSAIARSSSSTELGDLLKDSKPGLRDSGWVLEARRAHKNSPEPMKVICHKLILNNQYQLNYIKKN